MSRIEIQSKLWEYIEAHNLRDEANKRTINADAKLKKLFGKTKVTEFELAQILGENIT